MSHLPDGEGVIQAMMLWVRDFRGAAGRTAGQIQLALVQVRRVHCKIHLRGDVSGTDADWDR
jgi:hypothetical protein